MPENRRLNPFFRACALMTAWVMAFTLITPPPQAFAKSKFELPVPGTMVTTSDGFVPPMLRGLRVDTERPFAFDFILDSGNAELDQLEVKEEAGKLIRYFLASLTIPENDLWVNLSPYEGDRIIPTEFGITEMGRDVLAQDYILKQLTASLMYPEEDLGKEFWDKVYARAQQLYGTTDVAVNTFIKVWIIPDKAVVYEHGDVAYVLESNFKVMLEKDYVALRNNLRKKELGTDQLEEIDVQELSEVSSEVIRDVVIPEIQKEVNTGQNFARLRQIYHSLVLAKWYKERLKSSILNRAYSDQRKVNGVDLSDKNAKEEIYRQYLEAFKVGVFDYIREEYDVTTQEIIPRKYFSGGLELIVPLEVTTDAARLADTSAVGKLSWIQGVYRQPRSSPKSVNEFIRRQFREGNVAVGEPLVLQDGTTRKTYYVSGLLTEMGQLGHIGFVEKDEEGRPIAGGQEVIFLDSTYAADATVRGHEALKVQRWTEKRRSLGLSPEQMRGWLKDNLGEATRFLRDVDTEAERRFPLEDLYAAAEAQGQTPSNEQIASTYATADDFQDLNLAAGRWGRRDPRTNAMLPGQPVLQGTTGDGETFDEILLKELAEQRGVSISDLEADFQRTVAMMEEQLRNTGFIAPEADGTVAQVHRIFDRLIGAYSTLTDAEPGVFHMVDANSVNAFVIRNRSDVYFYKGLFETFAEVAQRLNKPLTEDIIAFIIAHELSHTLQHTSYLGLDVKELYEKASPYMIQMIKNAEYDADMQALEIMDLAGFSVFGAIDAMSFLEYISRTSQPEEILSSHPYVSLRKNRLSQIVFDQETTVFTNVKAPRLPMTGTDRLTSRDIDFRFLMDKSTAELLAMAEQADSPEAIDEAVSMTAIRRGMNALNDVAAQNRVKTAFMRRIFMQAGLSAISRQSGSFMLGFSDRVDFRNLELAAAVTTFGTPSGAQDFLEDDALKDVDSDLAGKIAERLTEHRERMARRDEPTDQQKAGERLLGNLETAFARALADLNAQSFADFLLPREEVEDVIELFTGTTPKDGERRLRTAMQDPRRLISAYFYADIIGQEPTQQVKIPTTDQQVSLRRRSNDLYLANPRFRQLSNAADREQMQDILLMRFLLSAAGVSPMRLDSFLWNNLGGVKPLLEIPDTDLQRMFDSYYRVFSADFLPEIAAEMASSRVEGLTGAVVSSKDFVKEVKEGTDTLTGLSTSVKEARDAGSTQELIDALIEAHPVITFARNAWRENPARFPDMDIEQAISAAKGEDFTTYSEAYRTLESVVNTMLAAYRARPRRTAAASEIFQRETGLNFRVTNNRVNSFTALEELPDWAVSDYITRQKHSVSTMIERALDEGRPVSAVFDFMHSRLSFADRQTVFTSVFLGRSARHADTLLQFFAEEFGNNPQDVVLWFMGMFSSNDALTNMISLSTNRLPDKAGEAEQAQADQLNNLAIRLLEFSFGQASQSFQPDAAAAPAYLKLIRRQIEARGLSGEQRRAAVYDAMSTLSGAVDLKVNFITVRNVRDNAPADFKSEDTSIVATFPPNTSYTTYRSNLGLHRFAWNSSIPEAGEEIFVTELADMPAQQLRDLLNQRLRYLATQTSVEYRDEVFSLKGTDDFYANLLTALLVKRTANPEWERSGTAIERMDEVLNVDVSYYLHSETKEPRISRVDGKVNFEQDEVNAIAFERVQSELVGTAIPSQTLDKVWDAYVKANNLQSRFPEFQALLQNPNAGIDKSNPLGDYLNRTRGGEKVPYRQVLKKFFLDSSVYSELFNAYVREQGNGFVHGTYRSLEDRLAWLSEALPGKSIVKDGIFDLWETDVFPEIVSDLPGLLAMARKTGDADADLFTLLGEMDDDVGRLQRLNAEVSVEAGRIDRLLDFYTTIIPQVFSPQKIARYGATAYLLWRQLPTSAELGLEQHLEALTKFMPEPSVLRDELLNAVASRYIRKLDDAQSVADLLYVNNLLSRNRDLRSEDFVSESVQHLFGAAEIADKRDVLLWVVGARDKPKFVTDTEDRYRIDFTSLPEDVRLLPGTVRDRFIEGFMLGDNGVLDPRTEADKEVMRELLSELFDTVFPQGVEGISETGRTMLARVFRVVMEAYPAYKRVQVIKALAELGFRGDFQLTSLGERLAVLLGVLGPVGIKVAQFLSENDTLIPNASLRSSLGNLRHQAPEVPKISAISVLQNEIPFAGTLVHEIGDPRGIASIKQVNGGRWIDLDRIAGELTFRLPASEAADIRAARDRYAGGAMSFAEWAGFILRRAETQGLDLNEAAVPVVYKIRRPNMDATLDSDYDAMDAVAGDLQGESIRGQRITNVDDMVATVKEWVELEKDFRNEAEFHRLISNLDYSWAETFAADAEVSIAHPRVYFASERVIVEEDVPGVPILDLADLQTPVSLEDVLNAGYELPRAREVFQELKEVDERRANILLSLYRAGYREGDLEDLADELEKYDYVKIRGLLRQMLLRQMLVDGVFHADLHQGNVLFTPEGNLAMIDRGNVGRLNARQIEGVKTLLKGVSLRQSNLIKNGIDTIFLAAEHTDGRTATFAGITQDQIQEILDEGFDLKMTMSVIGSRTVQGSARTQAEQDFSTFLKAFTQAIWLFPTDFANGVDSLQAIAEYVDMDEGEVVTAAEEQAKYFVVQDTGALTTSRDSDLMRITKDVLNEKLAVTRNPISRFLLRAVVFPLIRRSVRSAESDPTGTSSKLVPLIRAMGPRVSLDNMETLVQLRNFELIDAVGAMLDVPLTENVVSTYLETSLRGRGFGSRSVSLTMPILRGLLSAGRPVTRVYVDIGKEWLDSGGKRLIARLAPRMTVGESIRILAQVFPGDFGAVLTEFNRLSEDIAARPTPTQRQIARAEETPDIRPVDIPKSDTQTGLIANAVAAGDRSVLPQQEEVGGIDLNPNLLELQIEGDRLELNIPVDTDALEPVQIEGLLPVIINVTPITNLPLILGAVEGEAELYAAATPL